jgi:hypothetical protein
MEAAESTAGRRAPAKKRNNRAATVKRTMQAREACGERATLLVPYASLPAATCAGKALGARPLANLHLHTPPPGSVLYLPALAGALDSMKSFLGGAATGKPLRSTKWKTPAFALNLRGRVTHRVSLGFILGKRVPAFAVYGTAWLPLAELDEKLADPLQGMHAVLLARHGPCIWWALPTCFPAQLLQQVATALGMHAVLLARHGPCIWWALPTCFPAQLLQQVATALGSTRLANLPLRWRGQERDVDKLRVLVPEGGVARAGRGDEQRGDTLFQVQHSGHDLAADAPVINLDAQQTLACCERRSFLVADAHGLGVYALFR